VGRRGFRLIREVLSRHLPGRSGKNHEKSQNSRRCSLYSSRTPPKYKSRALPVHQPARCVLSWPRGARWCELPFACPLPSLHYGCRSRGKFSLDPLQKICRENRWVYTAERGTTLLSFLSFLVWPLLPIHRSSWRPLFDLIAFSDTHTVGRTPLDEGSARHRDLYLITHNTQKSQTTIPPKRCEPAVPASVRPQTHALDRAATVIGRFDYAQHYQFQWKSRCRTFRFPPALSNCLGVCLSSRFLQYFMHSHKRRPHLNIMRFPTICGTIHGGSAV